MPGPIRGGAYIAANPLVGGVTAKQVPLDTLNPAYPYTLPLASGGLVVRGTGPILVAAQCTVQAGITCAAQLRVNGVTVATGLTATASSITYVYDGARQGEVLTLWETDNGNQFAHRVQPGAAVTYITYEPIGSGRTPTTPAILRASLY